MNGLGITEAFVENQLVRRRVTFDVMKFACSLWFWPMAGVAVATWMASCGASSQESMTYPESRTVDVVDTLWGTAVADRRSACWGRPPFRGRPQPWPIEI